MKVETITISRRKPAEQYGYWEATMVANISEGEDSFQAGVALKERVAALLNDGPKPTAPEAKNEKAKEEPKAKEEVKEEPKKRGPKKKAAAKKETPKEEPKAKEEEPKKAPAKAAVSYDRTIGSHKKELASIFDELRPGWNKDKELASICKGISEEVNGKPIFDETGEILESFKEEVENLILEGEEDSGL